MKRKRLAALLCLTCTLLMAGCGKQEAEKPSDSAAGQETSTSGTNASDEKIRVDYVVLSPAEVEKSVTLGEYKSLAFAVNAQEATPENVYNMLNSIYVSYVDKDSGGITDRAVKTGDTVVIDYEGKKDGVAFAGGTAKGADLTIGSGKFIDGFEDGLIGVMPGETVDLNLTFPAAYGNADLAGQEVVFTVTVQYIRPIAVPLEEMRDDVAADIAVKAINNADINTVAGLQDFVKSYIEQQYENALRNKAVQVLVAQCEFRELPEELLAFHRQSVSDYFGLDTFEETYGYSADAYFLYSYNMTAEDFVNSNAEASSKEELAIRAVANAENISVNDEELRERFLKIARESGYETAEEYIRDIDIPWEQCRFSLICEDVIDFLIENAVIGNTDGN